MTLSHPAEKTPSTPPPAAGLPARPSDMLRRMIERTPCLADTAASLAEGFRLLAAGFAAGGTLFIAGNGGSMADALHISGELDKSFGVPRPVPAALQARLAALPDGADLGGHLQQGLRTVVLGINPSLSSAVDNDLALPHLGLAQELYALARPGDLFWGISTSGNARNICYAATLARALELPVVALTGQSGGRLLGLADVTIRAPAVPTPEVQNLHIQIYHTLCEMLEAHFFGSTSDA